MYERFTDRARKVMQLANEEAERFNHEYIGTKHILLGLLKEGHGVAANVLKNLNVDLCKVRKEVEKVIQPGPGTEKTSGKWPQTPRAKKVIEYAFEEARYLSHNYIGTEHLLLGLLRENEGVAAQILRNLGLVLDQVRQEILNLLGPHTDTIEAKRPGSDYVESADRSTWPIMVRIGLWGIASRKLAWFFVWLSVACAAACVAYGFIQFRFFSGGIILLAALWYYLSIKWVDQNSSWG
jgi:ATP-dependent Clp protease ATP-binding subunit ClpC